MPDPMDLDQLEAKAKAATPGPWEAIEVEGEDIGLAKWDIYTVNESEPDSVVDTETVAMYLRERNAVFIAAASPDVVLALIQRVRELERAITETRRLLLGRAHYFDEGRGEFTKISLDEIHAVLKDAEVPL